MTLGTDGQAAPGAWSWPDDLPTESKVDHSSSYAPGHQASSEPSKAWTSSSKHFSTPPRPKPTSSEPQSAPSPSSGQRDSQHRNQSTSRGGQARQKYWRPRTCRICLDTVNPTFHPASEHLPGVFQGAPNVTYDSEAGRLISPCKCKGSAKYVHESCLQQWRHADPSYGKRNYWNCPTCGFRYRLERMQWGHWISSTAMQLGLTLVIFMTAVFLLGFVADPIINLYMDPLDTISSIPYGKLAPEDRIPHRDDDDASWIDHFIKGFASLGLLGFIKVFFSLSPWQWWNLRSGGLLGSSGRHGNTGRDRVNNLSWVMIILGILTFLYTVWKVVRNWSRRVLQKASERVVDVQNDNDGDDDDEEEEEVEQEEYPTADSSQHG